MNHRSSSTRVSRKPRRKAKGNVLTLVLCLLAVVLLVAGVVVGFVLFTKSSLNPATSAPAGMAELSERFVGHWEGEAPHRPNVKAYYEVNREQIVLTGVNTQTGEWGDPLISTWQPVRAEGNTLTISTKVMDDGRRGVLELAFTSKDTVSITAQINGKLIGNFRRVVGK
jgi:hypothetical protein